jgi:hypothetical protein
VDGVPFAHLVGVEPQALSVLRSVHMERDRELLEPPRDDADETERVGIALGASSAFSTASTSASGASSSKTYGAAAAASSGSGISSYPPAPNTTIAGLPRAAYHCLTNQSSLLALQGGSLPGKLLWGSEAKLPVLDLFRLLLLLGVLLLPLFR